MQLRKKEPSKRCSLKIFEMHRWIQIAEGRRDFEGGLFPKPVVENVAEVEDEVEMAFEVELGAAAFAFELNSTVEDHLESHLGTEWKVE